MRVMKSFLTGALMAAVWLGTAQMAAAGPGCDPGELEIKFSHVVATKGHPKGEAAEALAERIGTELDGRACMTVYPNSTLYSDNDVLEAILAGDVHLAAPSLSKFEAYTTRFRLFDLPFLFEDIHAIFRFEATDEAEELKRAMVDQGLIGLAYWHNGLKQISANRPLVAPGDAQGLVFRVQPSEVLVAQIEALGATPKKLAFKDVYGALASGDVDGQENTWSNIYTKDFYTVQDGVTETNHGLINYLLVTSTAFLDSLDPSLRLDFERIVTEVTHEYNRFSFELNELAKRKMRRAGTKIRRLNRREREAWVTAFRPVWERFSEEIGQDLIRQAAGTQ